MSDHKSPTDKDAAKDQMHPIAKALFGWVDHKRTPDIMFYGLALASLLLIGIDFIIGERHEKVEFAKNYGFYAFYGYTAFTFVVLAGYPLGKLLRRDENFYGDLDDDEEDAA